MYILKVPHWVAIYPKNGLLLSGYYFEFVLVGFKYIEFSIWKKNDFWPFLTFTDLGWLCKLENHKWLKTTWKNVLNDTLHSSNWKSWFLTFLDLYRPWMTLYGGKSYISKNYMKNQVEWYPTQLNLIKLTFNQHFWPSEIFIG